VVPSTEFRAQVYSQILWLNLHLPQGVSQQLEFRFFGAFPTCHSAIDTTVRDAD
jgi:hypothetical protein